MESSAMKEALAFIGEVNLSLHGILSVSAKAKPKASTVIRAMDAIERASRWRPLVVFFDEFQEIVENLKNNSSMGAALRPFLKGNNAILEKRGSRVRHRERFMRLWVLLQVVNIPSLFPAGRPFIGSSEQGLLLPYLSVNTSRP
jgi:hypothetical protein